MLTRVPYDTDLKTEWKRKKVLNMPQREGDLDRSRRKKVKTTNESGKHEDMETGRGGT